MDEVRADSTSRSNHFLRMSVMYDGKGATLMADLGFVLQTMKSAGGFRFARAGWNGKGMYIFLIRPDRETLMTLPYLAMRTAQGDFIPWLASQTDILADDWIEV